MAAAAPTDRQPDRAASACRAPGRPPAAAAGRGRARGGDRRAGRAWPAAGRGRRDLLAVPALQPGRFHQPHRLAPVGAHRPAVPARPGMGGGGERLAVGRQLGVDGLPIGVELVDQGGPGPAPAAGARLAADPGRRADRAAWPAAPADRRPGRHGDLVRGPAGAAVVRAQPGPDPAPAAVRPRGPDQRLLHPSGAAARAAARLRRDGRARPPAPGPRPGGAGAAVRRPGALRRSGAGRHRPDRQRRRGPPALSGAPRGASRGPARPRPVARAGPSAATSATSRPSRRCWRCTPRSRPRGGASRCSTSGCSGSPIPGC